MDALKKAEQEKKEAAKRLKEAQEKSGLDLTLEESSPKAADEAVESNEADKAKEAPAPLEPTDTIADGTKEKFSGELSLAPIQTDTEDEEATEEIELSEDTKPPPDMRLSPDSKAEITQDEPGVTELEDESAEPEEDEAGPEERSFALDGLSVEEDYISPLEETGRHEAIEESILESAILTRPHSDSRTSQSTLTALELAKTLGDDAHVPRPVAAQTVFNAAASQRSRRQVIEWSLFVFGFALFIIAGSVLYYLNTTPKNAPPTMPVTADTERVTPATPEAASGFESVDAGVFVTDKSAQTLTDPLRDSEATVAITETTSMTERVITLQPEKDASRKMEPEQVLPEEIEVAPAILQISRSRSASQKDVQLHSAYQEYKAGNFAAARSLYLEVLNSMPENKDALLGLAAIAHKNGELQSAYRYYLKVLKLFPSDVIARTAIINIAGDKSAAESESILKLMIRDNPETAFLHFTLGNIYAAGSHWTEAQQSFFDAYRFESENADYAYNLAVSLDHLGKTQAALQYYERAMKLADKSPAKLNVSTLASRISALSALSQGQ